jgi:protein subunit release factor A
VNLTAHNLDVVLGGNLREFTDALAAEEKRELLAAQTADAAS